MSSPFSSVSITDPVLPVKRPRIRRYTEMFSAPEFEDWGWGGVGEHTVLICFSPFCHSVICHSLNFNLVKSFEQ